MTLTVQSDRESTRLMNAIRELLKLSHTKRQQSQKDQALDNALWAIRQLKDLAKPHLQVQIPATLDEIDELLKELPGVHILAIARTELESVRAYLAGFDPTTIH